MLTDEIKKLIKELTAQKNIALPEKLNAVLRPYQQRGYSWMYSNAKIGFGCVLADDMGLGKNLQVIATLLKYKEEGALEKNKALVVAPPGTGLGMFYRTSSRIDLIGVPQVNKLALICGLKSDRLQPEGTIRKSFDIAAIKRIFTNDCPVFNYEECYTTRSSTD